jgi:hypothetical protein
MLCHNNQQCSISESCDDRERQMGVHTVEKLQAAGLIFPGMYPINGGFKQTADYCSQSLSSVISLAKDIGYR